MKKAFYILKYYFIFIVELTVHLFQPIHLSPMFIFVEM